MSRTEALDVFLNRGADMDPGIFDNRGVDMSTGMNFFENRGVDMDIDTA